MRMWAMALATLGWMGHAVAAPPATVVLDAANMTCPACSITIEKALERVSGVTATDVDTRAGTVTVTFDAQHTSTSEIAQAITEAGFPATQASDR